MALSRLSLSEKWSKQMTGSIALMERNSLQSAATDVAAARAVASKIVANIRQLGTAATEQSGLAERIDELAQLAQTLQAELYRFGPMNGHGKGDDEGEAASQDHAAKMTSFPPNIVATINLPIGYVQVGTQLPLEMHLERFDQWYSEVIDNVQQIRQKIRDGVPFLGHGESLHALSTDTGPQALTEFAEAVNAESEGKLVVVPLPEQIVRALQQPPQTTKAPE